VHQNGDEEPVREEAFVPDETLEVLTVRRAHAEGAPVLELPKAQRLTQWSAATVEDPGPHPGYTTRPPDPVRELAPAKVLDFPVAATATRAAYVAGTFDTKGRELTYLRQCLEKLGLRVVTVDLATSGRPSPPNTALATQAMRALPIGCPKVMVSTMASGDTRPYVGPSDICMMYSVTDVQGINRISEKVLANAAHALAGMIAHPAPQGTDTRPALGLTMFGVTTACVQAVTKRLGDSHDCLVFHATGVGGQSMEKLADSGLLAGVIDVTTTEIADEVVGGVLSAGPTRLDVFARHPLPYVGSCGALDMVNFGPWDSVPERFRGRRLHRHNPSVTLMRTTAEECRRIGEFIADKLNAMSGPMRFLIPEGGVSAIDRPGQPFHDPEADRMLFDTVEQRFRGGGDRQLVKLPWHINDEAFADALVLAWADVSRARRPDAIRELASGWRSRTASGPEA
jgi:uncharacterized protein (UPF0261 family)